MNKNKTLGITIVVNIAIFLIYFAIVFTGVANGNSAYDSGPYSPDLAAVFFISIPHGFLCLLFGIILVFIQETRKVAQGLLLSSLIIFILGFSSCFG